MTSNPNKKFKKFRDLWLNNDEYKEWLLKGKDENTASCRLCNTEFTVKHAGVSALDQHKRSDKHKEKLSAQQMSQNLSAFVVRSDPKSDEVAVSELCITYHTIRHHLSYRSTDCSVNLMKTPFKDSFV
jgi:hypothetical protein